jgi:hypothetical protein
VQGYIRNSSSLVIGMADANVRVEM